MKKSRFQQNIRSQSTNYIKTRSRFNSKSSQKQHPTKAKTIPISPYFEEMRFDPENYYHNANYSVFYIDGQEIIINYEND